MKNSRAEILLDEEMLRVCGAELRDIVLDFTILAVVTVSLGFILATMFNGPSEMAKDIFISIGTNKPAKSPTSPAAEVEPKKNWYARPEDEGGVIVGRILAMAKESSSV